MVPKALIGRELDVLEEEVKAVKAGEAGPKAILDIVKRDRAVLNVL